MRRWLTPPDAVRTSAHEHCTEGCNHKVSSGGPCHLHAVLTTVHSSRLRLGDRRRWSAPRRRSGCVAVAALSPPRPPPSRYGSVAVAVASCPSSSRAVARRRSRSRCRGRFARCGGASSFLAPALAPIAARRPLGSGRSASPASRTGRPAAAGRRRCRRGWRSWRPPPRPPPECRVELLERRRDLNLKAARAQRGLDAAAVGEYSASTASTTSSNSSAGVEPLCSAAPCTRPLA